MIPNGRTSVEINIEGAQAACQRFDEDNGFFRRPVLHIKPLA
jgi:hypothetical protein